MLFVGTSIIHPSTEGVFLLCNILDLLIYRYRKELCDIMVKLKNTYMEIIDNQVEEKIKQEIKLK